MNGNIKSPFFVVSPKAYLQGEELLELANLADKLAGSIENSIFCAVPTIYLSKIAQSTKNVIVTAQYADGFGPGHGMGRNLLEDLKFNGIEATFLNHKECQMNFKDLVVTIEKAKELEIITIACADGIDEAKILAYANPNIILCEPYDLIGTGITSPDTYVRDTIKAIRDINKEVLVMEGAGITNGNDVKKLISLGADGTGVSSIISKEKNKEKLLKDLLDGLGEIK